ncbi:zinc ribbon domain-containing protein [Aneurinibacillus sp. BA2021]|nr:zinc ribbon domain-containing protein [Aneurinibacillus sp. BA2021]
MSKTFGVCMMAVGIICLLISMFEFLTLDMWETPRFFWLFFVGASLIFLGFVLLGPHIQRYWLKRNGDIIRDSMKLMGRGLQEGLEENLTCPECNYPNKLSANFCSHCGTSLRKGAYR